MWLFFLSIIFFNYWMFVIGLCFDCSGIVGNKMEDLVCFGEIFMMVIDDLFWWNENMLIWVDVEKVGICSVMMFWFGVNVVVGGMLKFDSYGVIEGGMWFEDW